MRRFWRAARTSGRPAPAPEQLAEADIARDIAGLRRLRAALAAEMADQERPPAEHGPGHRGRHR